MTFRDSIPSWAMIGTRIASTAAVLLAAGASVAAGFKGVRKIDKQSGQNKRLHAKPLLRFTYQPQPFTYRSDLL
jgi:hypothetical protein